MPDKVRSGATLIVTLSLILALIAGVATPVAGATYSEIGEPELSATVQGSNVISAGETARLEVMIQNSGTDTTEQNSGIDELSQVVNTHSVRPGAASATDVEITRANAPISIKTGTQSLGTVGAGDGRSLPLIVEVNENAKPGTYRLPVEFSYRYVRGIEVDKNDYLVMRNDETTSGYITVRIEPSVRLSVVETDAQGLYDGADGRVQVTVRNDGTEVATNTDLAIVNQGSLVPQTNGASLGALKPNQTAEAAFRVGVNDIESASAYGIGFQMSYEDTNGVVSKTAVRTGEVQVRAGPEFDISVSEESLYVDSTGAVRLNVTNTGDRTATDARVSLAETEPFVPLTSQASLGTLAPGESTTAQFKLEVTDRALAGDYPIPAVVTHDDRYGNSVESHTHTVAVSVAPEATIETTSDASIAAGSTNTVSFTVTNDGDTTMQDAVVRINTDSPFETDDDTAYVGTLEPGESTTVSFTITADGAATAKPYVLDTTVKYDNMFGERTVTDVESTSIGVTGGDSGLIAAILNIFGL
jgi:hypothetical protein